MEGDSDLATKPRLVRIVLAVLSSIMLTAVVVLPLAFGAYSARSDDRATIDTNTRLVVSTSTTVADIKDSGVPGNGPGRGSTDGGTPSSLPPRIETEVLPKTESRDGGPDVFSDATLNEWTVTTVAPPGPTAGQSMMDSGGGSISEDAATTPGTEADEGTG